jgi:cytosine/adenosine deaminase-related metal-dependent hydrolase
MNEHRLRVRHLFLSADRRLGPTEIVWDARGRIVGLHRLRRGAGLDLAVLPGLVDAHAHLQLPALARPVAQFLPWIDAVMASRRTDGPGVAAARTAAALRELESSGCTAVAEIDADGSSPAILRQAEFAGRCYQEVTGFHLDAAAARAQIARRRRPATRNCPSGVAPHAPYSVSAALFRAAARASRYVTIHCAEVPEEQEFLHTGRGAFAALLARLGRLPAGHRAPGTGAVRWLERLRLLRPGTLLVHCQHLEPGDVERIRRGRATMAVCPGTIAWFRRSPPPLADWLRAGIAVGLGTDSRASNGELSMRAELRRAATLWPDLPPSVLLHLATAGGADAIGRPGLGRLRLGAPADFFAVPAADADAVVAAVVHGELPTVCVVRAGREVAGGGARC